MLPGTPRRRFLAILALAFVPWTVLVIDRGVTVLNGLFPLFVLDYNPGLEQSLRAIPTWRFFLSGGGIPRNTELWPASILLLAGLAGIGVAFSFSHRLRYTPLPAGSLFACALAWWYYWPAFRAQQE